MKSGVAAMTVAAIQAVRRASNHPGIVLLFTGGEESGSLGARCLQDLRSIVGEIGALIVPEPTSNYPFTGHKGALWLEALTTGKTAHGSMPEQGDNAVYKAARAVVKLEQCEFQGKAHPIMGKATLNVGTISGGLNLNSVPDSARLEIDIRTTPEQDNAAIFQHVTQLLGQEVLLSKIMNLPPVWTDPGHPWIQDVFAITSDILKFHPEPRSIAYFTDASFLVPLLDSPPTLIMGPGEAVLAHQTDEYCRLDRLEKAVELYETMCTRWRDVNTQR
jgi:succinyl-diaminopimelate desuccinylase